MIRSIILFRTLNRLGSDTRLRCTVSLYVHFGAMPIVLLDPNGEKINLTDYERNGEIFTRRWICVDSRCIVVNAKVI